MAFVRDTAATLFIVATMPMTIYHSVQAALKSKTEGASDPHVRGARWYLAGGWFSDAVNESE